MMAFDDNAYPRGRPRAARLPLAGQRHPDAAGNLALRLPEAAALLGEQPDEAALLLDGLLRDIVDEWHRRRNLAPDEAAALRLIERVDPLFGWRLRLALRAPDAHARLHHCVALLAMVVDWPEAPAAPAKRR